MWLNAEQLQTVVDFMAANRSVVRTGSFDVIPPNVMLVYSLERRDGRLTKVERFVGFGIQNDEHKVWIGPPPADD